MNGPHPYARLSPEIVLDAIECFGMPCTGALTSLNSYENRVYLAETEDGSSVVAKAYRPGRWSDEEIVEEHRYVRELFQRELPVTPPLALSRATGEDLSSSTLLHRAGFRFAVYPRIRGRAPELDRPGTLEWIGRLLGRIHAVGAIRPFQHRSRLSAENGAQSLLDELLALPQLPLHLRDAFASAAASLLTAIAAKLRVASEVRYIRLHGDCHPGNLLWTAAGPHFVDFDDCANGPAVQDLWMMLSGGPNEMGAQLGSLLAGYRQFHDFDPAELALIEPLRGLHAIRFCAWLGKRWSDPAFPRAFPWFGSERYWEDQTLELREQLERLDQIPALAD